MFERARQILESNIHIQQQDVVEIKLGAMEEYMQDTLQGFSSKIELQLNQLRQDLKTDQKILNEKI